MRQKMLFCSRSTPAHPNRCPSHWKCATPFDQIRPVRRWSNETTLLLTRFVRCDVGRAKLHSFWQISSGATLVDRNYIPLGCPSNLRLRVYIFRRRRKHYETNGGQVPRRLRCEFGAMPKMITKQSTRMPATNPCLEVHKSFTIQCVKSLIAPILQRDATKHEATKLSSLVRRVIDLLESGWG